MRDEYSSCTRCHLAGKPAVPGEGPVPCSLMLVGEAPSWAEEKLGRPFVGPAGAVLDECLAAAGIVRGDTFCTNTVKHRPNLPNPEAEEIVACRPWLEEEIDRVDPAVVVLLGATAGAYAFPPKSWGHWRFWRGRLWLQTWHPAAALPHRNPALKTELVQHLRDAKEEAQCP